MKPYLETPILTLEPETLTKLVWMAWFFKFLNSWLLILEKRTWNRSQKKARSEPHAQKGEPIRRSLDLEQL
jgi:hypothetical protein